ncbi:MAG: helix-turn-helix domain-containing protein [Balneolaceae bacterium]
MPSLGKDLAEIRKHLKYTIDDLHQFTKIPVETIKAIESGDIFRQSLEINTYVRSFVRTYAKALKIKDEIIVKALDQQEIGNYNHLLLQSYPEISGPKDSDKKITDSDKKDDNSRDEEIDNSIKSTISSDESGQVESTFKPAPAPYVRNVNWADLGRKISTHQQPKSLWLIGIGIIALITIVTAYFLFGSSPFYGDEDQTANITNGRLTEPDFQPGGGPALDFSQSAPETDAETVLADTLYLVVYAATDNLDPVRVWSDLKPRIDPYWIDRGVAMRFEFQDSIRVRGRYSQMLLFLNGHLIENFRQEHFNPEENMVELTRSFFASDPKWLNTVSIEIPDEELTLPDSIIDRPSF